MHNKLAAKVNNIDTTGFILKTYYDLENTDAEKRISHAEKKITSRKGIVKRKS